MSLLWKIVWTIVIAITGTVSMVAVWTFLLSLKDFALTWSLLWQFIGALLMVFPAWFAWKGTKLVPFLTNFIVRIILIIIGCFVPVLLIVFALIGIWLKS